MVKDKINKAKAITHGLDRFHYHEVLDRSYLIVEMFNEFILEHPVVEKHKELKKDAEKLSSDLYLFYCSISGYNKKKE